MVESELRFYSVYYVAYGLMLLRTAGRAEREPTAVRALAGALFLAGVARVGAWLTVGSPHPVQQVLLAVELTAPPLVIIEQAGRRRKCRRERRARP